MIRRILDFIIWSLDSTLFIENYIYQHEKSGARRLFFSLPTLKTSHREKFWARGGVWEPGFFFIWPYQLYVTLRALFVWRGSNVPYSSWYTILSYINNNTYHNMDPEHHTSPPPTLAGTYRWNVPRCPPYTPLHYTWSVSTSQLHAGNTPPGIEIFQHIYYNDNLLCWWWANQRNESPEGS